MNSDKSDESKKTKKRRGRPRRALPKKTADKVSAFCARTGKSRSTAFRMMERGLLRYVQVAPGGPREIPFSEYDRLGYDRPDDDSDSRQTA
jgi:hypothetical protein